MAYKLISHECPSKIVHEWNTLQRRSAGKRAVGARFATVLTYWEQSPTVPA